MDSNHDKMIQNHFIFSHKFIFALNLSCVVYKSLKAFFFDEKTLLVTDK